MAVRRRAFVLGGLAAVAAAGSVGYAEERDNPTVLRLLGGCGSSPPVPASAYSLHPGTLDSAAMGTTVPWTVALPPGHSPGDGTPLVVVLHGRDGGPWEMTQSMGLPGWASRAGLRLAFAAPGGGKALYWHPRATGIDPVRYVVDEFLPMVERRFGVGGSKQARAVLGWSMGGYGALLLAQQHGDLVSACAAASPAVFTSYHSAVTGHADTFDSPREWETYGVWPRLAETGDVPVRLDCGNADPFAPTVRAMLRRIPGATGAIGRGCHDPGFWRRVAPAQLRFLAAHLTG